MDSSAIKNFLYAEVIFFSLPLDAKKNGAGEEKMFVRNFC
jgi:hypothetical protein